MIEINEKGTIKNETESIASDENISENVEVMTRKSVKITSYIGRKLKCEDKRIHGIVRLSEVINYSKNINIRRGYNNNNSSSNSNTTNSNERCVMCGDENKMIASQNKSICKPCDSSYWLLLHSEVVVKFCKGCKNFATLSEFEEKPEASKCGKCRRRGRTNYMLKKSSGSIHSISSMSSDEDSLSSRESMSVSMSMSMSISSSMSISQDTDISPRNSNGIDLTPRRNSKSSHNLRSAVNRGITTNTTNSTIDSSNKRFKEWSTRREPTQEMIHASFVTPNSTPGSSSSSSSSGNTSHRRPPSGLHRPTLSLESPNNSLYHNHNHYYHDMDSSIVNIVTPVMKMMEEESTMSKNKTVRFASCNESKIHPFMENRCMSDEEAIEMLSTKRDSYLGLDNYNHSHEEINECTNMMDAMLSAAKVDSWTWDHSSNPLMNLAMITEMVSFHDPVLSKLSSSVSNNSTNNYSADHDTTSNSCRFNQYKSMNRMQSSVFSSQNNDPICGKRRYSQYI